MEINYEVMAHKDMDGNELINKINEGYRITNAKEIFIYDGKPYAMMEKYNSVIDGTPMVLCRWCSVRSTRQPILKAFYGIEQMRAMSRGFKVEDITGYDIVDAYGDKRYLGTFRRITTK